MRIGVINWDVSLPPDTYMGSYFAKTMSYKKWRYRTPYYADIISEDNICCHYRTQEEFDKELEYAIAAKIDYFAYVWETDDKENSPRNYSMNYARRMHQSSRLREKIKLCAIIMCCKEYTERDFCNLAEAMKSTYYEKVGNRPIVYLYTGYHVDIIEKFREFPQKYNTEDPYIVFLTDYRFTVDEKAKDGYYSKADAVSAYSHAPGETYSYSQFIDTLIEENEKRKEHYIDTIPLYSLGWDPTPRIDIKVPWITYGIRAFSPNPTSEELIIGAKRLSKWIKENKEYTKTKHVMVFSWNEFEEGAFICPTLNEDETINDERITSFAQVVDILKKEE